MSIATQPGRVSSLHMDYALRDWEDRVLSAKAMFRQVAKSGIEVPPVVMNGPLAKYESAREFVFKKSADLDSLPELDQFQVTEEQRLAGRDVIVRTLARSNKNIDPDEQNLLEQIDNGIMPDLVSWGRESRRVFTLDQKTARLFGDLTYDSFTWDDTMMVMPFASFMVEIPDPAHMMLSPVHAGRTFGKDDVLEDGMFSLTGILVTHPASVDPSFPKDEFCMRVFLTDPRRTEPYSLQPFMTGEMRRHIRLAIKGDNIAYQRYMRQAEDMRRLSGDPKKGTGLPFRVAKSEKIVAADLIDDGTNTIRKIVAGLCLYLAHAPGEIIGEKDARGSKWTPSKRSKGSGASSKAISDMQNLFEVRNIHEFNPQTGFMRFTDASGREVSAHARREHMRREKYTPLDAPKTIRVRATWVNRIGRQLLPVGAATVIR
ncbi:MAG: hypothetical protein AAB734_01810 [Patescibacteria group bacterium]